MATIGQRPAEETLEDILAELTGLRQMFQQNNKASGKNQQAQQSPNNTNSQSVKNSVAGIFSPNAFKNAASVAGNIKGMANAYIAMTEGALKLYKNRKKIEKATKVVTGVIETLTKALEANKDLNDFKGLDNVGKVFEALSKLSTGSVMAFWLYNKLITPKVMQNFVSGLQLLSSVPSLKDFDFKGVADMINAIGNVLIKMVVVVTAMSVLTKIMPWKDILIGAAATVGIIILTAGGLAIVALAARLIKPGIEAVNQIGDAIKSITIAVGLLVVLVFAMKALAALFNMDIASDGAEGIKEIVKGLVSAVIVGVIMGLGFAKWFSGEKMKNISQALLNVSMAIGLLIIDLFALMLLAKYQQSISWELLGRLGESLVGILASTALLNLFSSGDGKQAMYSIIGIGLLIGLLAIDLLMVSLLVKYFPKEIIDTAMGIIMTFLNAVQGIITMLAVLQIALAVNNVASLGKILTGGGGKAATGMSLLGRTQNPTLMTLLGIALVIGAIAFSIWLVTKTIKENGTVNAILGVTMMGVFIGAIALLVYAINKIRKRTVVKATAIIAPLTLFMAALTGLTYIAIQSMKDLKTIGWEDMAKFGVIMVGLLAISIGLTAAAAAASTVAIPAVALALVVIAGLSTVVLATTSLTMLVANQVKKLKEMQINQNDVKHLFGIFKRVITGIATSAIYVVNEFTKGSVGDVLKRGAGTAMILSLSPTIYAMGVAMQSFAKAIVPLKQNNIQKSDTEIFFSAFDSLVTGIVNFADNIQKYKINDRTSFIMKSLGEAIVPLIDACSKFINIIISFKNAKMPKAFDEKGNVTEWQTINAKDFSDAADAITTQFTIFLNNLLANTRELKSKQVKVIKELGEGIVPIIGAIGNFVDGILKLAVGQVNIGEESYTDENGNVQKRPKYVTVTEAMFTNAADQIIGRISAFILKLKDKTKNLSQYSSVIIKTMGEGIGPILSSINNFVDAIIKIGSGWIIAGEHTEKDANGNLVVVKDWKHVDENKLQSAGENLGGYIVKFIEGLANFLDKLDDDTIDLIKDLQEPLTNLITGLIGTGDKGGPVSQLILMAGQMALGKYPIGFDKEGKMQFMEVPGGAGIINENVYAITTILYTFIHGLWQKFHSYKDRWEQLTTAVTSVQNILTPIVVGDNSILSILIKAYEDVEKANLKSAGDLFDVIFGTDYDTKINQISKATTNVKNVTASYQSLLNTVKSLNSYNKALNKSFTTLFNTFNKYENDIKDAHKDRIKRINETKTAISGVAKALKSVNNTLKEREDLLKEQHNLSAIQPIQATWHIMSNAVGAMGQTVREGIDDTRGVLNRILNNNTTNNSNVANNTTNNNKVENYNNGGATSQTISFNSKVVFMLPNGQQLEGWMISETT